MVVATEREHAHFAGGVATGPVSRPFDRLGR
jgi:hypothetical protein